VPLPNESIDPELVLEQIDAIGSPATTAIAGPRSCSIRCSRPGKLYQTYQVFADGPATLELRALTVDQSYWVAIESFDESGVSKPSSAVPLR
jgi:hypothetical protein